MSENPINNQLDKKLDEKPINPYEVLGISFTDLLGISDEEHRDEIVKRNYISRLQELQKKIRGILDNLKNPQESRLEQIEALVPEIFQLILSFKTIRDEDGRAKHQDTNTLTLNIELASLVKDFDRQLRIVNKDRDNARKVTAYEIFSKEIDIDPRDKKDIKSEIAREIARENAAKPLTEQEKKEELERRAKIKIQEKLDLKVQRIATRFFGFDIIPKGLYKNVEELEHMAFQVLKYIWAYSKLKTPRARELYDSKCEMLTAKIDSESEKAELAAIVPMKDKKQRKIRMQTAKPGTPKVELSERAELIEGIQRDDGTIFQLPSLCELHEYVFTITKEGKTIQDIFYSNIDMKRFQEDSKYRKFVMKRILDSDIREFSKEHLGNYIGEMTCAEALKVEYNSRAVAMCRKYQEQKREENQVNHSSNPSEGTTVTDGDEELAHE